MTKPLRAALYARFSTDMQRDASIDDQIRTCHDYAEKQGMEVVEVFSDKAMSGASLMRSGIQNLLRSADSSTLSSQKHWTACHAIKRTLHPSIKS